MRSMHILWKCVPILLMMLILGGCGNGGDDGDGNTTIPEGAIWTSQTIRLNTPPAGFNAFVIWAQTATLKGGQSGSERALVTIDYWRAVEETDGGQIVLYEEHYAYNDLKTFSTNEAGLYTRYPRWFDPEANDEHFVAWNMRAQNGELTIDVSRTPDNIVHWWTPRQSIRPGARCLVEIRLKVEGKCSVQLGADYWRSLTSIAIPNGDNNREAWISNWIGDTNGQYVTVTAPIR